MDILLILTGAGFSLLYLLTSLIQVVRGKSKIGFWGTLLAFGTLLASTAALAYREEPFSLVRTAAVAIAAVMIVVGIVILAIELRRNGRHLSSSRGMLGIGVGILLVIVMIALPLAGQLITTPTLSTGLSAASLQSGSIVNVSSSGSSGVNTFAQTITEETGLTADEIEARITAGDTVAALVQAHGGDLDRVQAAMAESMQSQFSGQAFPGGDVNGMVAQVINGQAPAQMSQRVIEGLLNGASSQDSAPAAQSPVQGISQALGNIFRPAASDTEQQGQAATATSTPTATLVRPTLPSPTPTNTPFIIATATPQQVTADAVCQGVTENNVNLRTAPGTDNPIQLTIPAGSSVGVASRNQDSTWLYATYQVKTGWLSADYVTLGERCGNLPVQP